MEQFLKNFAHLSHGMLLCFFLLVSFDLFQQKEKNRLLRFLLVEMVFWAFIELKDLVYLYEPFWYDHYVSTINLTIDMWTIPATMLLMFEVLSPGWARMKQVLLLMLPSMLFTVLFVVADDVRVFHFIVGYSFLLGTFSLLLVWVASKRYDRFILRNFSYVENIGVAWVRVLITLLYIMLVVWTMTNVVTSWLGDIIFYLSSLALWGYIYYNSRRHNVVEVPNMLNLFSASVEEEAVVVEDGKNADGNGKNDLSERLSRCMKDEKLYLNPKLGIADVAVAVGTNRTYLSHYINNTLNISFYEYVNKFRAQEAARLLLERPVAPLVEIAEACGFNSLSTFRRSFERIMGQTPAAYRAKMLNLPLHTNKRW